MKQKKSNKSNKQNKSLKGGDNNNVIGASIGLIDSLVTMGKSIFTEIHSLTHINQDINAGVGPSPGVPPNPPLQEFHEPNI